MNFLSVTKLRKWYIAVFWNNWIALPCFINKFGYCFPYKIIPLSILSVEWKDVPDRGQMVIKMCLSHFCSMLLAKSLRYVFELILASCF